MNKFRLILSLLFCGQILGSRLSIFELIKPGGLIDDLKQVGDAAKSTIITRNPRESHSYAPSPVGAKTCEHKATKSSFFVRVFSSCGTDCCDSTVKKRCTGVVIKEDTVLVAASCIVGYNCFKICYGSDLCGEREPCVNSKEAYVHPDYIDNVHLRLKMEDNIGLIKIPLLKQITPIPIAHFQKPDCSRFAGKSDSFKFIGCGDGGGTFPKIQREIGQKPVGGSELGLVYSIARNSSEPQPCCGDEGGPLVITGQDLIKQYGKDLEPAFKKFVLSKNKLQPYLIAILSYFEEPCDSKSQAVYTCLHSYQPLIDGYACETWTHLSVAHDLLLSIDNTGLNAIDNIYSSKNLDIRVDGKTNSIRSLVKCIVDQRYEALKEAKHRLDSPDFKVKEHDYQCGGRGKKQSKAKKPVKEYYSDDKEINVSSVLSDSSELNIDKKSKSSPKKEETLKDASDFGFINESEDVEKDQSKDQDASAVKSEAEEREKSQTDEKVEQAEEQDEDDQNAADEISDGKSPSEDDWPFNLSPKSSDVPGDIFAPREGSLSENKESDNSDTTASPTDSTTTAPIDSFRDSSELSRLADESSDRPTNEESTGTPDELSAGSGTEIATSTESRDETGLPIEEGSGSHAASHTEDDAAGGGGEGVGKESGEDGILTPVLSLLGESKDTEKGQEESDDWETEVDEESKSKPKEKDDVKPSSDKDVENDSEDDWVDDSVLGIEAGKSKIGASNTDDSKNETTADSTTLSPDEEGSTDTTGKGKVGASLFKFALGDSQMDETTEAQTTTETDSPTEATVTEVTEKKKGSSKLGASLDETSSTTDEGASTTTDEISSTTTGNETEKAALGAIVGFNLLGDTLKDEAENDEVTTTDATTTTTETQKKKIQNKLGASRDKKEELSDPTVDAVADEVFSEVAKNSHQELGDGEPKVPVDSETKTKESQPQALEQDEDVFDEDTKKKPLGEANPKDDKDVDDDAKLLTAEEVINQAPEFNTNKLGASNTKTDEDVEEAVVEEQKPETSDSKAAGSEAGKEDSKVCSVTSD